jgi:serine/threonine-protein kinase RsbW
MSNFSLHLPADFDYLHLAREFSKEVCLFLPGYSCASSFIDDVKLAVSEACTNAMIHGKKNKSNGQIILKLKISPGKFLIRVLDQGEGFDLSNVPIPCMEVPKENGYGIFLIKLKMDTVDYQRGKNWNTLTMEKNYPFIEMPPPIKNTKNSSPKSSQV